jgi:hypothetical protein
MRERRLTETKWTTGWEWELMDLDVPIVEGEAINRN